ncbi:hypothetical protein Q1695_012711 [Nippostrongylus brasiliensis]|nr:hypothetical protein Q1695_012711 [Nippostrongylus brasiliensis]
MGVHNLLPFVKNACRQGNVREFAKCSVAVDVSCLLHKGLFGCADSVAQGKKTNFYIYYVEKHVKALLNIGCHVILVFDGRPLPAKKNINEERRQRRSENVKAGERLIAEGKIAEASDKFKRATSITSEVVECTIQHFRELKNVDVIVAPYEADAQLTFLVSEGFADLVITEDSDLIAFGCERIALKWNCEKGECVIYERCRLPLCFTGVMRSDFDFTKFRRICILSGCDYLQAGLPGVGLNKALSFFSKTSRTDLRMLLPRIPNYLNMSKLHVSKEFVDDFIRAENTFLYQVVFDPRQRCQRPLSPYPQGKRTEDDDEAFKKIASSCHETAEDFSYAGEILSSTLAVRLALGNQADQSVLLDKFFLPSTIPEWSVWCDNYHSLGTRKRCLEKENREEMSCGAVFQFDSPSKKRRRTESYRVGDDTELRDKANSPTLLMQISSKENDECSQPLDGTKKFSSPKVPSQRVVKNEADRKWSVEEMLKIYGSQSKTETLGGTTSYSPCRSAYFVRRSASCSNPFRKPIIKAPENATTGKSKTEDR